LVSIIVTWIKKYHSTTTTKAKKVNLTFTRFFVFFDVGTVREGATTAAPDDDVTTVEGVFPVGIVALVLFEVVVVVFVFVVV
jgi:hypothetical protein